MIYWPTQAEKKAYREYSRENPNDTIVALGPVVYRNTNGLRTLRITAHNCDYTEREVTIHLWLGVDLTLSGSGYKRSLHSVMLVISPRRR